MDAKTVTIKTSLAPNQLMEVLKSITVTDISQIHNSKDAVYYGELTPHTFDIKNLRYSPMSTTPNLQGVVEEDDESTLVKVNIDIASHFKMIRGMYYSTLIPIGVIIMFISLFVLGGTGFQFQGIIFSSSFIICALLFVSIMRASLINMKRKELKEFTTRIDGTIIVPSNK